MSTKLNARSPFYLNLVEPTIPEPEFTCEVANVKNLTIDQQGQINTPDLDYGTLETITSTDSDFTNNKFATETTATNRALVLRILIPVGYSNVSSGFIDCPKTVLQPALVTGGSTPSCSGGPTKNGTISAKTINGGGSFETINLASFFSAGSTPITAFTIYNPRPSLVNASVNGNVLTVSSNNVGGATNIQVSASDDANNTCTATQTVTVTVNAQSGGVIPAFACGFAAFSGGSITAAGAITKPDSVANVGTIRATANGSAITSVSQNTGSTAQNITLFFDLTAPAGFTNAGSIVKCSFVLSQKGTAAAAFTCSTAGLFGQQISSKGQVSVGSATSGTIASFTPLSFAAVDTSTSRTVNFTITIPSGFSNSGTISCSANITQPATLPLCGSNSFKLSGGKTTPGGFCSGIFSVVRSVKSTISGVTSNLGGQICDNNSPFDGGGFYYAVSSNATSVGPGTGSFYIWQIDSNGIVQDVLIQNCPTDGSGNGKGKGGSL